MATLSGVGEVELIMVGRVLGMDFRLVPAPVAAKKNGYHVRTVQRWADNGEIIAIKKFGRWYVHDQLIKISRISGCQTAQKDA